MPTKRKNKKQVNGFILFMQDIKPQLQREGHNNKNTEELVPIAHPRWKALSGDERECYNVKARQLKRQMRENGGITSGGRLDCTGQLLAERKNLDVELRKQRQVERTVRDTWPSGNDVCYERFYLVTFESLCQLPEGKGYLPCEVAVVEYSLNAGIIRTYHRFIDPGPIPMGFRFLCLSTSEETHQIPIENFERAESDYAIIWTDICNFLNPDKKKELPVLYTLSDDRHKVEFCIDWLAYQAGVVNRLCNKIYELEGVVSDLYCHINEMQPSLTSVNDMFQTTSFDYETNTRCDFHEQLENKHCALGVCKINCYIMSDALATVYDIQLTGSHVPERADPSYSMYVTPIPVKEVAYAKKPSQKIQRPHDISPISLEEGEWKMPREDDELFTSRDIRYQQTQQLESQPLRRPKGRGIAGTFVAAQSQPSFITANQEEWPSLGGYDKQGAKPKKYANSKIAPPPSAVPQPATSWRATGRGRGIATVAGISPISIAPQFSQLSMPNSQSVNGNSAKMAKQQIQQMFRGTGRGRGLLYYPDNL